MKQPPDPAFPWETSRLIMRPFREADLTAFADYRSDPEIAAYQAWATPLTVEDAEAFYEEIQRTIPGSFGAWYQVAVERKSDGVLLGDVAFCVRTEEPALAEIGYTFAREHQGRGYALEAATRLLDYLFGTLESHRVVGRCDVENVRSWKLMERLGMRREAHFIDAAWFAGGWTSEYWYALLYREWEARQHLP